METKPLPEWAKDLTADPELDWLNDFEQLEEENEIAKFLDSLEDMLIKDGPYGEF